MHDSQPRAGQHRDHGLGDQRQIDGDPVAGHQAEAGQRVGRLGYFGLQIGVGQRAAVLDRLAYPVDRDAIPVAGLDMAIHAVVSDVELAADKPFGERRIRPVQDLTEWGGPGQPVGLFGPECEPVLFGLAVQLGEGVRLLDELGRGG